MVLTVVALDYLHDAWFYWTHRLLHWKPLYRHVHYLHHRYATPARLWIPKAGKQLAELHI
jgi:Delta7-sterol 5-desaturase